MAAEADCAAAVELVDGFAGAEGEGAVVGDVGAGRQAAVAVVEGAAAGDVDRVEASEPGPDRVSVAPLPTLVAPV
ncbi:MAG: hypothetical protein IPQ01_10020 [Zoogloea sp.]|nr:hypothetical protein [Zoogloea sp.]